MNYNTNSVLFRPEPTWSGMTHKNNLARIRQINPKWGSDIMTYLHSANSSGMTLESYLKSVLGDSVNYETTDDPLNFMIYGDGRQNTKLVGYRSDTTTKIGLNKARFTMLFDAPLFSDVHVIVGMNDRYRVRVVSDPIQEGTSWAYECEAFGPSDSFIPVTELSTGTYWSRDGAPVPMTMSMKGAKPHYTSPYAITFNWSSVRTQRDISGNMKQRPVAFAWKGDKGQTYTTWEDYDTWVNDLHFAELKNKTILWGRDTMNTNGGYDDIDERSGEAIVQGPGFVQQMERGNIVYYNSFDIKEFGNHLLKLRYGKTSSDKTHYVVSTGTYGLQQVNDAIADEANGWEKIDNKSLYGSISNMGFGHRFTSYYHSGGFRIDFRHEPMLDLQYRTPVKHPNGGYARSYEYHIMDLGETKGEKNVSLHYVETAADLQGIIKGLRNPFSPGRGKSSEQEIASALDGWSEHRMSQFMVTVKNPNNTLIYRPNILA